MSLELEGKIYRIDATVQVSDTFSKREFIVETDEQYKQYIMFQMTKDKCSVLDGYKKGDAVKVSYNLQGRLWSNPMGDEKCFNTLQSWLISKLDTSKQSPAANTATTQTNPQQAGGTLPGESDDEQLPF
jgi:hypothetical protein